MNLSEKTEHNVFPMNSFPTIWLEFNKVRREGLALSIGSKSVGFYVMMEAESLLRNVVFNKKQDT
jgi:hypothetical protein